MRESKAATARQAVEDAAKQVGVDRQTLQRELERRIEADPELFEAFAEAAKEALAAEQETKH